jgi:Tfp pilus assembly protein FimV
MSPFRLAIWPLILTAACYPSFASALGLGEISLHSALAEPLKADIGLLEARGLGSDEIKVRLAPSEVFASAGVERPDFLSSLRFVPILEQGRQRISVSSTVPVNEPYLNFIVELTLPGGQLLREYTLLLDPPLYQPTVAAQPLAEPEAPSVTQVRPVQAASAKPRAAQPLPVTEQGKRYRIMPGDSLWGIAGRMGNPLSSSREAFMADLFALNPAAFIDGDRNRLRVGAELLLPDSAAPAQPIAAKPAVQTQPVEAATTAAAALATQSAQPALAELSSTPDRSLIDVLSQLEAQVLSLQAQMDEQNRLLAEAQRSVAQRQSQVIAPPAAPFAEQAPAERPTQPQTAPAAAPAVLVQQKSSGNGWLLAALGLLALLAGVLIHRRRTTAVALTMPEPRAANAKRAEASFPDINPFHRQVVDVTEMTMDEYLGRGPAERTTPGAQQPQPAQLLDEMLVSLPDDLDALTAIAAADNEATAMRERLNEALGCIDRGEVDRAASLLVALLDQNSSNRQFVSEQLARIA